jgi:cysteine synthase
MTIQPNVLAEDAASARGMSVGGQKRLSGAAEPDRMKASIAEERIRPSQSESAPPTPLVRIDFGHGLIAWAKLEGLTEAQSHKIRAARAIVADMQARGQIGRVPVRLLLSSSGRAAQAFAYATAGIDGVELIVISDVLSPSELLEELDRFPHVKKIIVDDPDRTGSHIGARMRVIADLQERGPHSLIIDQYDDRRFPEAYLRSLVPEVIAQAAGKIAAIYAPTGTGALIRSFDIDKTLNDRNWLIVPVDAEGSALFRPAQRGIKRNFSGYGNARPTGLIEECRELERPIYVPDLAVVRMARWLTTCAGLHVGPSSAAVAAAFIHAAYVRHPSTMRAGMPVLIFPDDGGAYRNTLYDAAWLSRMGLGKAV